MTQRGLRIDNALRLERIGALETEAGRVSETVQEQAKSLLPKLKRRALFEKSRVCKGCRNGKKKRLTCGECHGAGRFTEWLGFNPDSTQQAADVLYTGLRLPQRTHDGKVTTDEEALQSLLSFDKSGLVGAILRYRKLATMREQYERLEPAVDGYIRTVFNPAGTYTYRFSSAGAFFVPFSTNLQNLTESEAARDPLYRVRDCIIPDEGEVLLYVDLSQAEARVVACLSEDEELLRRWADPKWDIHTWTASAIFGIPEKMPKDDPKRFLGKQSRHAFNYGEGPNKFWRTINGSADITGVSISLAEARACFAGYHKLHPNLDKVWWTRVEAAITPGLADMRRGSLRNCFGAECLFYPRFDPNTDGLHPDSLRAAIAWEPQSTIGMLTNMGLLALWEQERGNGFRVLHQTHDGVVVGADKHRVRSVARLLKSSLEREITVNGRRLLVPAEVFLCEKRWSEPVRVL